MSPWFCQPSWVCHLVGEATSWYTVNIQFIDLSISYFLLQTLTYQVSHGKALVINRWSYVPKVDWLDRPYDIKTESWLASWKRQQTNGEQTQTFKVSQAMVAKRSCSVSTCTQCNKLSSIFKNWGKNTYTLNFYRSPFSKKP